MVKKLLITAVVLGLALFTSCDIAKENYLMDREDGSIVSDIRSEDSDGLNLNEEELAKKLGLSVTEMNAKFDELEKFEEELYKSLEEEKISEEDFFKQLEEKLSALFTEDQIKTLEELYMDDFEDFYEIEISDEELAKELGLSVTDMNAKFDELEKFEEELFKSYDDEKISDEEFDKLYEEKLNTLFTEDQIKTLEEIFMDDCEDFDDTEISDEELAKELGLSVTDMNAKFDELEKFEEELFKSYDDEKISDEEFDKLYEEKLNTLFTEDQIKTLEEIFMIDCEDFEGSV